MMKPGGQRILQGMTEWPMTDIMQQHGTQKTKLFIVCNFDSPDTQFINRILHEVHSANGMLKAIVQRPGIN